MKEFTFQRFQEQVTQVNENIPGALTEYSAEELGSMDHVCLSRDQLRGFLVKSDETLGSVFNLGIKGRGRIAVVGGIERGGRAIHCFEPLVDYYSTFGFEETAREPNWTLGEADVVSMQLNEERYTVYKNRHLLLARLAASDHFVEVGVS